MIQDIWECVFLDPLVEWRPCTHHGSGSCLWGSDIGGDHWKILLHAAGRRVRVMHWPSLFFFWLSSSYLLAKLPFLFFNHKHRNIFTRNEPCACETRPPNSTIVRMYILVKLNKYYFNSKYLYQQLKTVFNLLTPMLWVSLTRTY